MGVAIGGREWFLSQVFECAILWSVAMALGVVPVLRVPLRGALSCSMGSQGENPAHYLYWTSGGGAIGVTSFLEVSFPKAHSWLEAVLLAVAWWCSLSVEAREVCHVCVGGEVQRTIGCWMSRVDVQDAVVISVSAGRGGALEGVSDI
jgi:hypothetical protein